MANPDRRSSLLRKLVSAARSVFTYQVGLPIGCIRLNSIVRRLRDYETIEYSVFAEYLNATLNLPIGTERLNWDIDSLREHDQRLEAINQEFRARVFDACYDIILRYATPNELPQPRQPKRRTTPRG